MMEQNGTRVSATPVVLAYYEGEDRNEVVRLYDKLVVDEMEDLTHLVGQKKYTEFRGSGRESAFSIALMSLTKRALEAEEKVESLQNIAKDQMTAHQKLLDENKAMKESLKAFHRAFLEPGTDEWVEKHPRKPKVDPMTADDPFEVFGN